MKFIIVLFVSGGMDIRAPWLTDQQPVTVDHTPASHGVAAGPSLPTYDMAVAARQQPVTSSMTSSRGPAGPGPAAGVVMSHQAHLLSGGNTLVMLPTDTQVCCYHSRMRLHTSSTFHSQDQH